MTPSSTLKPPHSRCFYPAASAALLVLTFIGFRLFYLQGQAYPGRPLTPPIRVLLIVHGVSMTAWMILSVVQSMLVAVNRKQLHRTLGALGASLAALIVIAGYLTAVEATRLNPADMKLFGLTSKQFLTVPLTGVVMFGAFVLTGVLNRRRPEVHRPMMFMASMSTIAAAMGRIAVLNDWYAGTRLEHWFSAFLTTLVLGVVLLVIKWVLERRFDRWFAGAFGVLAVVCVAASLGAKTDGWSRLATILAG